MIEAIRSPELEDLAEEYAQVGLDSILEGGLDEIPFVKTIVAVGRIGSSVRDAIFTKKLVRFLCSIAELSEQERSSMISRLDAEESYRGIVGERIIELLDKVDSFSKPEMVGRAFQAFAQGKIDYHTLNWLNVAIERLPLHEVANVRPFYVADAKSRLTVNPLTAGAFVSAGLVQPSTGWGQILYKPTTLCDVYIDLRIDGFV